MNPTRKKRILLVTIMIIGVGTAIGFALYAFNQNLMFYLSPSQVAAGEAPGNSSFRMGGIVVEGSVKRDGKTLLVSFDVTDGAKTITIEYEGILPDLFREGQVILAKGRMSETGKFKAAEVLAKHDENYMPREVAESLMKASKQK